MLLSWQIQNSSHNFLFLLSELQFIERDCLSMNRKSLTLSQDDVQVKTRQDKNSFQSIESIQKFTGLKIQQRAV